MLVGLPRPTLDLRLCNVGRMQPELAHPHAPPRTKLVWQHPLTLVLGGQRHGGQECFHAEAQLRPTQRPIVEIRDDVLQAVDVVLALQIDSTQHRSREPLGHPPRKTSN